MVVATGLTAGGWLVGAVISKLISELTDYAKGQMKKLGLKAELARLNKALPKIQAVVNAVDPGMIRENQDLETWLWQLRDAVDQGDDLMDEMKYYYEKERVEAAENKVISNFKTFFLRALDKDPVLNRLKEVVKAIDEVAADVGDFYMLVKDLVKDQKEMVKLVIENRETSSVLNKGTHVFGREKEKEDIIKKLLNPDCKTQKKNLTMLPIIGVGGVGKTTLVRDVYNDLIVEDHFELRMWVCISNSFDKVLLTKKLYECVCWKRADFDTLEVIQNNIKNKLKSKRFLVVFDDVWYDNSNKEGWNEFITPLTYGQSGSMILLTTREERVPTLTGVNVVGRINLKGLNEGSMWDLFKECSFGDKDPDYHQELQEIGRGIVTKLKGSPLVAKTIGGILSSDLNELHWRSILESELWNLEQGQNEIMPALRLTYEYLPSHLKPCFLFCSIFPEDHIFDKNDLINMWIALGMVSQSTNGKMTLEDVGSKYFDDMLSKSIFIQDSYVFKVPFVMHNSYLSRSFVMNDSYVPNSFVMRDSYVSESLFVMHDLIRDLSIFVSQGECLRTSTNNPVPIPNTVRHLYAHIDGSGELNISGLKNVRTLFLYFYGYHHPKRDSLVTALLKGMESLRILILVAHNLREFPECVSELLHLRYLNISSSRINAFPKSVSKLYLLETMVCNDFRSKQLKQADALGMLINLRHLIAQEWLLHKIPGIGRLTSLQELSFRVGKENAFKICELGDLKELRSLKIDQLENVGSREEVIQANLGNKVKLSKLILNWSRGTPWSEQANEYVIDHLQPHSGLKELIIDSYYGTGKPPTWFGTKFLSKLVRLEMSSCNFDHLFCLEELTLLKYIHFSDMNAIKRIIHECNQSSTIDAFPSLVELSLSGMQGIKKWCYTNQPNKWMKCLRKLHVVDCPQLQDLPPVPIGVKKLRFERLGLNVLPKFWNDEGSKLGSSSALVVMLISKCTNLVSLSEGLLQKPEQFEAIEELNIDSCMKLMNLPPGGFSKFISLKELRINFCPMINRSLLQEECFLPCTIKKLSIFSCGYLDTILPKALEKVNFLIELELIGCANITSLPPKEVFNRWKALKTLILKNCPVLASIESLLGLSSIKCLQVCGCPKLLPGSSIEIHGFPRSVSAQPQLPSSSSTTETPETSTQDKPLLSVDKLLIDDPLLLSVEPIRSLSSVRELTINDCSKLKSLPKLPPFLQNLRMELCCRELWRSCKNKSGPDWPILSKISKVIIIDETKNRIAMDEYDVIVLGTGLKECILSGLLSVIGYKVLHMDRNDYDGGNSTSLNLIQLWKRFRREDKLPADLSFSENRKVDMNPKLMMANGTLVRALIHTDVAEKYLFFRAIDGSYVFNKGKVHPVPATEKMALESTLMVSPQKERVCKFLRYVQNYDESDPMTQEGLDLTRVTTKELMSKYGLDENTIDFIGHALALHRDDSYLDGPAHHTTERMKLYDESLVLAKGGSPYIYPNISTDLIMAFAKLSADNGGAHMFNRSECKVEFDMEGKTCGVTSEGETFECKKVVCDPSYVPNKVRKVGKVARAIAIMSHCIPNTDESPSVQVILPQKQLGRNSDMYLLFFPWSYMDGCFVGPTEKYIAFVSCEAETDNPELELKPGVGLLGSVDEIFYETYDKYEPVNEPTLDNCFISTSYDATTDSESTEMDVFSMYTLITAKTLDLTSVDLMKLHILNS